jgi:Protein of unknown function (DUF1559)
MSNNITAKTRRILLATVTLLAISLWTSQAGQAQSESQFQYVDASTFASLKIDTKSVELDKLPMPVANVPPALLEQVGKLFKDFQGAPLILTASIPQSSEGPLLRLIVPTAIAEGELKRHPFSADMRMEKLTETLTAFSSNSKNQKSKRYPLAAVGRQAWGQCSASAGSAPVQLLVVLPDYFRHALVELQTTLPESAGGIPSSVVADGLVWLSVGYLPKTGEAKITIQSTSDQAAKALVEVLPQIIPALSKWKSPYSDLTKLVVQKVTETQPTIIDSQIKLQFTISKNDPAGEVLSSILQSSVGKYSSVQKLNKMKEIMLAVHNFVSANNYLPPLKEHRNQDGTSKLSWRVHLLPYLGEIELYQKFKLDEAWDSPHNKPLAAQLPMCYRMAALQAAGYTTVLAPSGKDTVLGSKDVVSFGNIVDGTSNTVFLVEVKPENAVPWTKPQDYDYDPKNPLAGILVDADGKFAIGIGDGSARMIGNNLPVEMYDYLFRKSDGNAVQW